ncbi:hypothetical protein E4U09_003554 [Claviceps aff. purpurea]|uniref:MYND-type domain-containing protein n=1 Tax=Claviceps aff. purpurea TaxID=1967640 RepID=A0A9P7QEE6_9HYPO|nr:hypothetical protein E4U09_003554 [Claviceps aff. purpurea]
MMWEEAVGATPQGLGPDDFENWLWNNETPKGLARPTSLSSQSHFSGFADLPSNNGVGTSGSSKKRHWCFLGEIVEDSLFHPLLLDTKDIHGEKVELHFYTKDKGLDFMPNHSQKRHTIVVFDATKYTFKFGPPGIRLEDPRKIQIFPLSLARTLALNDLVRRLSTRQHSNTRTCHGCGKDAPASSMKRCSMCLSFWYCNKECQTAGWTKKGHKIDCGYLRHPDLRGLFFTNWDEVQDPVRFPLQVADDFC